MKKLTEEQITERIKIKEMIRDLYKCRKCRKYTPHTYLKTREDHTSIYRCTICGTLKYIYRGMRLPPERSMGAWPS